MGETVELCLYGSFDILTQRRCWPGNRGDIASMTLLKWKQRSSCATSLSLYHDLTSKIQNHFRTLYLV